MTVHFASLRKKALPKDTRKEIRAGFTFKNVHHIEKGQRQRRLSTACPPTNAHLRGKKERQRETGTDKTLLLCAVFIKTPSFIFQTVVINQKGLCVNNMLAYCLHIEKRQQGKCFMHGTKIYCITEAWNRSKSSDLWEKWTCAMAETWRNKHCCDKSASWVMKWSPFC